MKQFRTVYIWHLQDRGILSKGKIKGIYHQCTNSKPSLQAQGTVSLQGNHWHISEGRITNRCRCASVQQLREWRCHRACHVTIPYSKYSQISSDKPVQEEGFGPGVESQQSRPVSREEAPVCWRSPSSLQSNWLQINEVKIIKAMKGQGR